MDGQEQFIARQPIFDVAREVVGYALLFRSGVGNSFANVDGNDATRQVLINTLAFRPANASRTPATCQCSMMSSLGYSLFQGYFSAR